MRDDTPPLFPLAPLGKLSFPPTWETPLMAQAKLELEAKVDAVVDGMRTGKRIILPFTAEDLEAYERHTGPPAHVAAQLLHAQAAQAHTRKCHDIATLIALNHSTALSSCAQMAPETVTRDILDIVTRLLPREPYPVAVALSSVAFATLYREAQQKGHVAPGKPFSSVLGLPYGVVAKQDEPAKFFRDMEAFRQYLIDQEATWQY